MAYGSENIFKLFQEFLTDFGDQYDTIEAAMSAFIQSLDIDKPEESNLEIFPEIQSLNLVEKSFFANSEKERKAMLHEALDLWPDNIDAKMHLIDDENAIDYLRELEQLWYLEKAKIDIDNKKGWSDYSQRPYWRLCHNLALTYNAFGLLVKASQMYEYIVTYNKIDPMNSYYDLLTIYCRTYQWDKALALFENKPDAMKIDRMLVPILILSILLDKEDKAQVYMDALVECHQEVDLLLDEDQDQFDFEFILDLSQSEMFEDNSLETTALAFAPLTNLLAQSNYVYHWFVRYFEETETLEISDKVISISFARNKLLQKSQNSDKLFENIGRVQVTTLKEAGLLAFEDFLKVSEDQVLAIKNIGPRTLQQLKQNGVQFKK